MVAVPVLRRHEGERPRTFLAPRAHPGPLEQRGFGVQASVKIEHVSRTASDALDEAERRVTSQLAILDDASYESGIARMRALAPDDEIAYRRAGLHLEARKGGS